MNARAHSQRSPRSRAVAVTVVTALTLSGLLIGATTARAGLSFVRTFQTEGQAALDTPDAIAVDAAGVVYVADRGHNRIVKFRPDGDPMSQFGNGSFETQGTDGHLYLPNSIAYANDHVYVGDAAGYVQVFQTNGVFVKKFGGPGGAEGQFDHPDGIAADCDGNIYVADSRNKNVQKFTANGAFLLRFGLGHLDVPIGVAVASNVAYGVCQSPYVFVADEFSGRIAWFDTDGTFEKYIGEQGRGPLQFDHPDQLAIDLDPTAGTIDLWAAESGTARVQHIRLPKESAEWVFVDQIAPGSEPLNAPHGVALRDIKARDALRYLVSYNQLDSCHVIVRAHVTIPPHAKHEFTTERDTTVGDELVQLDLSDRELGWIEQAWKDDRKVGIAVKAHGLCPGAVRVKANLDDDR